jgi:hypothetical protein
VLKPVDKIGSKLLGRRRAADSCSPPYTLDLKLTKAVAKRHPVVEGLLLYFGILLVQ